VHRHSSASLEFSRCQRISVIRLHRPPILALLHIKSASAWFSTDTRSPLHSRSDLHNAQNSIHRSFRRKTFTTHKEVVSILPEQEKLAAHCRYESLPHPSINQLLWFSSDPAWLCWSQNLITNQRQLPPPDPVSPNSPPQIRRSKIVCSHPPITHLLRSSLNPAWLCSCQLKRPSSNLKNAPPQFWKVCGFYVSSTRFLLWCSNPVQRKLLLASHYFWYALLLAPPHLSVCTVACSLFQDVPGSECKTKSLERRCKR